MYCNINLQPRGKNKLGEKCKTMYFIMILRNLNNLRKYCHILLTYFYEELEHSNTKLNKEKNNVMNYMSLFVCN